MNPKERKAVLDELKRQLNEQLDDHFADVERVKGDDGQINFGISVQIETAENGAHTVTTKMSFSEKHSFTLERDIDDPNQQKLPGEVGEAATPRTKKKSAKKT